MRQLRVGTRASKLAMVQTGEVVRLLQASFPEIDLQVVPVRTGGDASPETPLTQMHRRFWLAGQSVLPSRWPRCGKLASGT